MKLNKLVTYILMFLPLVATLIVLPFLPDTVPIHFDINMQVDRYGSKYELLIVSAICIMIVPIMKFFSTSAAKQEGNGKNNEKIICFSLNLLLTILNAINGYLLFLAFKSADGVTQIPNHIVQIMFGLMGITFIILGNIMPKAKKNSYVGFRTIWSKKNAEVWKKSQRFGGISMMLAGTIIVVTSIFASGIVCVCISMGVMAATVVVDIIYSYIVSKKY